MYPLLRPLLFQLDPETAHNLVMGGLGFASRSRSLYPLPAKLCGAKEFTQPVEAMGIRFPNPLGLAAGLDKQAAAADALGAMGFGFVELGTVTPQPQPGNPRPRMFRLKQHRAIINRMGFNSIGLDAFIGNLGTQHSPVIRGINIGKNAVTPVENAVQDYLTCLQGVYTHADYITINISSPNTKNLRELQQDDALDHLLDTLNREREQLADRSGRRVPLAVKIAPELTRTQVIAIAAAARRHQIDGIIATNTTVSREGIEDHPLASEQGGLSGPILTDQSTRVIDMLYRNLQGEIPIIGVGGIHDQASALEKLQAGAVLLQVYTSFIYQGPQVIGRILDRLELAN